MMDEFYDVKAEIYAVKAAFDFTEEQAIGWIRSFESQYDSVFLCDLQRYVTGDKLAKEHGVHYA